MSQKALTEQSEKQKNWSCCWNIDFKQIYLHLSDRELWSIETCICLIGTSLLCRKLDVSASCPISKEAVPPQKRRLSIDTERWCSILHLVCSSRSSMWLARSFGSVITATKAEGKIDWSAPETINHQVNSRSLKRLWIHCCSQFFVLVFVPFSCKSQLSLLWDV